MVGLNVMDLSIMIATKKPTPFHIIRHRGMPNKAQLPNGTWVERQDKIYVEEWNRFIPVAPYDDHFLYKVYDVRDKGSDVRCTCGSIAVISGYSSYKDDASQQGLLYICHLHASTGKHATGGAKWV